jgi:hypothetical protein
MLTIVAPSTFMSLGLKEMKRLSVTQAEFGPGLSVLKNFKDGVRDKN